MSYTHEVKLGDFDSFTEIVEDEALAARLATGKRVTFRVLEDEWTGNATNRTRTIRRAEIVE